MAGPVTMNVAKPSRSESKMTSAERELLLKNLAESRERLLQMAKNLSREELHSRPAPGRWTVAECVEHIVTVEKRLLGAIQKTLETAPDSSKRSAMDGQDEALIAGLVAPGSPFPGPRACGAYGPMAG